MPDEHFLDIKFRIGLIVEMDNIAWWYTVVFGVPSLVLGCLVAALAIGLTRSNRTKGTLIALGIFLGIVLLGLVLMVCVPIVPHKWDEPAHGAKLAEGNWVTVWEHPTRADRVVKQWHTVHQRRSTWDKMWKRDKGLFPANHRSFLDYYGWAACMIVQWRNNELATQYHGRIWGVPATDELDPDRLSWAQERGVPVGDRAIGEQLAQTNRDLNEHKLVYMDMHAANVMMNSQGQLLFVDGELSSGIELGLSKGLYRCMGTPFVPVASYDHILWADEEGGRDPPVTSENHAGFTKLGKYKE